MSKYGDRFIIAEKQGGTLKDTGLLKVIADREAGVNCLRIQSGCAGGLTPLPDADGKPIITKG